MEISNIEDFKHLLQSARLNLLIGSGLSCPYLQTLGGIEKRFEDLEAARDNKFKDLIRASLIKTYFESCLGKNDELCNESTLEGDASEVLKNYGALLHNINKIILLRRSNLLSKQVNLFTTNVDIFLEKALEEQKLEFNDGFSGTLSPSFELSNFKKSLYKTSPHYDNKSEVPIFNLFKLHGSTTWRVDNDKKIKLDSKLNALKEVSEALEGIPSGMLCDAIKPTDKEGKNRGLKAIDELVAEYSGKEGKKVEEAVLSKLLNAYERIPMIHPTKEKFKFTTLNYTYYELLRMFSNELERENSVLFVMGFSFADEHIREIVLRAINSNPTLLVYVFPYDAQAGEDIKGCLGFSESSPKNNNLKLISPRGKQKNSLANINSLHFCKLADSLFKTKDDRSAETKNRGEENE